MGFQLPLPQLVDRISSINSIYPANANVSQKKPMILSMERVETTVFFFGRRRLRQDLIFFLESLQLGTHPQCQQFQQNSLFFFQTNPNFTKRKDGHFSQSLGPEVHWVSKRADFLWVFFPVSGWLSFPKSF